MSGDNRICGAGSVCRLGIFEFRGMPTVWFWGVVFFLFFSPDLSFLSWLRCGPNCPRLSRVFCLLVFSSLSLFFRENGVGRRAVPAAGSAVLVLFFLTGGVAALFDFFVLCLRGSMARAIA
ncbi:hypothetical protein [Paracoccus aminovorans]|uniref:hypothetical protein n=1 Tax=Paracoccus aminovorans TaxID=34004 RepID=UPI002B2619E9|nr:hypothetical protein [Paracoccus aminovorans]